MFQTGKEVHEPGRKLSGAGVTEAIRRASVGSNSGDSLTKSSGGTTYNSSGSPSQPKRSSGVQFENLTNLKRGSQDYGERRASHGEMQGGGGLVSGWFNKTFRGIQPSAVGSAAPSQTEQKSSRGVME